MRLVIEKTSATSNNTDLLANPNYLQLEYLEATGTQYIDTGIYGNQDTALEADVDVQTDSYQRVSGTFNDTAKAITLGWNSSVDTSKPLTIRFGDQSLGNANIPRLPYGRNIIKLDKNGYYINGTQVKTIENVTDFETTGTIWIFNTNPSTGPMSGKIYNLKIYDGKKVSHNYIPALRKSDMKPGMFDKVTGNFYTNVGTGEFKYGSIINAVLPKEYRELEYLESTGKQRIDTGIYMNSTYGVEIEAKQTSTTTGVSRYLFGDSVTSQTRYMIAISSASNRYICDFISNSNRIDSGVSGYDEKWHTHKVENKTYYVDGVSKGSVSITDFVATKTSCLFSATASSPFIANYWQIKKSQIWDNNGKLLQCLIPALRISDSKPGMFDLVSGNFYINVGGDEFTYKEYFDSIYEEVEYVYGGTGSNIDTGFVFKDHLFKIDMAFEDKSSRVLIGSAAGQACYIESNSNNKYSLNSNGSGLVIDLPTSVRRVIETKRTYDSENDASTVHMTIGEEYVSRTTSGDPNKGINFTLFPSFSGYEGYAYNYGTKVYDLTTDELVADLIPCVIKATGEAGMYDKVSNTFKSNSGTGDLVAGPKVKTKSRIVRNIKTYDPLKLGYEVLEYLQADSTQIIDTEIIPTNTTGMRAVVSDITPRDDANFLGCRTSSTRFMFNIYHYNTLTAGFKDWLNDAPVSYQVGKKYELKLNYYNNRKFEGEGVSLSFDKTIDEVLPSVAIFAQHTGGVNAYNMNSYKCHEFEMTDGNRLIMHLLPVRRILDGELGMYDTITGKFFRNLRNTEFIAGPKVTKSLPGEFEEIEYLESSGTQYIDTGIYGTQDLKTELTFQELGETGTSGYAIFGNYSGNTGNYYLYQSAGNVHYWQVGFGAYSNIYEGPTPDNEKHTALFDNYKVYLDGTEIKSFTESTFTSAYTLLLFNMHNATGGLYNSVAKRIFSCKMWKDGILVRDMVPVRKINNGELGMYDKANKVFYTNQGTGKFIAGPSVDVRLPSEYTELDYVESTGTQYIATDVVPTNTTGYEVTFDAPADNSTDNIIFGCREDSGNTRYWLDVDWSANDNIEWGFGTFSRNDPAYRYSLVASDAGRTFVSQCNLYNCRKCNLNGTDYLMPQTTDLPTITYPIYIFCANKYGTADHFSSVKIRSIKITEGISLTHQYIPALRKSDGKTGMFDLVEREFLTSTADTDLIAGPSAAKEMIYVDSFNRNYEFIEYLQGDGFSHIDTGVIPTNTMGLKVDFADVSSTLTDYNFIGTRLTNNGQRFSINNTNNTFGACFSNYIPTDIPLLPDTRYVAYQNYKNNRKYNFDGIEGDLTEDLTATLPSFMLFAQNTNNGPTRYAYKIYSCQLTDDNKITHEYLPVRRKVDGVLGMYDTVTNTFLANAGTGTFTAGKTLGKIVNRIIT